VASNPEFLAEGTAVNDLMKPDRVIMGSMQGKDISKLANLFRYAGEKKLIFTNNASAELSKLAANCFLAQRVSSINSIAILCEEYESDVQEVKKCIASDTRIGDKFLNSSVGFGGSCFKKDILALIYLAESKGLEEVAEYWNQVIEMNSFRKKNFFLRVFKALNHNLVKKRLCIMGTAFKKDTNDPRESPAV
jgi:UDPglucose 6-dehydrogenase